MAERPTTGVVAVAWLKSLTVLAGVGVATTLPGNTSTWAAAGFLVVEPMPGGSIDPDSGQRDSVLALHAWAITPNANTPPWGKASQLLEDVLDACLRQEGFSERVVPAPGNFLPAHVLTAVPLTDAGRIREPDINRAHYVLDLALSWVEVPA